MQPPPGSKVGERIYFEGFEGTWTYTWCRNRLSLRVVSPGKEPLSQLNPKKKIFETIQPGFTTLESKEAAWVDPATKSVHKIRTQAGVCLAPNFVGASLS